MICVTSPSPSLHPSPQNAEALLQNGECVSSVLMVDKDQVLMETIGAVQELKTLTVKKATVNFSVRISAKVFMLVYRDLFCGCSLIHGMEIFTEIRTQLKSTIAS